MPYLPHLGRFVMAALCALLLSACAGRYSGPHYYGNRWDGRRGYDGNGDYGYDLNASRAEASSYRARASRSYPSPGPASDPWGPHIQEAAARFGIPDRWIREVMRQESGGRLQNGSGGLTTSPVGAMGLMQVMPATYDMLRRRYSLGSDPYEPRDNIMAGAAYIREMYDRFGAPAFLAAYNAGPDRTDAYLAGATELPDETVNYLARVAPRLGTDVAMTGPLATYAGSAYARAGSGRRYAATASAPAYRLPPAAVGPVFAVSSPPADRAYAGGGMTASAYYGSGGPASGGSPAADPAAQAFDDPADRAFDGGGLVTAGAPLGTYAGAGTAVAERDPGPRAPVGGAVAPATLLGYAPPPRPANPAPTRYATAATAILPTYVPPLPPTPPVPPTYAQPTPTRAIAMGSEQPSSRSPASWLVPVAAAASIPGSWGVQVGAFPDPALSRAAVAVARSRANGLLAASQPSISAVQRNGTLYRARLVGLSANAATAACTALVRDGIPCLTVPPGS